MVNDLEQVPTFEDLEKSLSEYIEARGEARLERAHRFSLTESEIEQLRYRFS